MGGIHRAPSSTPDPGLPLARLAWASGGIGLGWLLGVGAGYAVSAGTLVGEVLGGAGLLAAVAALVVVLNQRDRSGMIGWAGLLCIYFGAGVELVRQLAGRYHWPWWIGLFLVVALGATAGGLGMVWNARGNQLQAYLLLLSGSLAMGGTAWLGGWYLVRLGMSPDNTSQKIGPTQAVAGLIAILLTYLVSFALKLGGPVVRWATVSSYVGAETGAFSQTARVYQLPWWTWIFAGLLGAWFVRRALVSSASEAAFLDGWPMSPWQ